MIYTHWSLNLLLLIFQIGKLDKARERKLQKEIKNQVDAKQTNSKFFKELILVVFSIMTVGLAVYGILYFSL